jgi:hypothetical protein
MLRSAGQLKTVCRGDTKIISAFSMQEVYYSCQNPIPTGKIFKLPYVKTTYQICEAHQCLVGLVLGFSPHHWFQEIF